MSRWPLAMWAVLASACGDGLAMPDGDTQPSTDAASTDGGPVVVPDSPTPPVFAPCPSGWAELISDGLTICEPYPNGVEDCGPAEAHFPGEPGCRLVGPACPEGRFPPEAELPTDRPILFVDGQRTGGDGSRERPLPRLEAAIARAEPGALVVVAPGTYETWIHPAAPVTVRGACASRVRLLAADSRLIQTPPDGVVEIEGVTLGPTPTSASLFHYVYDGAVHFRGTVVVGTTHSGVRGPLQIEDSLLRGNRHPLAVGGATISIHRTVIRGGADVVASGSELGGTQRVELEDVALLGGTGRGVTGSDGSTLSMTRTVIDRATCDGIVASGTGMSLRMQDVIVRDTVPCPDAIHKGWGNGVTVGEDAVVDMQRTRVEGSGQAGVLLVTGVSGTLEDVVIRDTLPRSGDGAAGYGVALQHTGALRLSRVHILRSHSAGFQALGQGTVIEAHDMTVADTQPRPRDQRFGHGMVVDSRAALTAQRVRVAGSREVGLLVASRARVDATDLLIEDTLAQVCAETTCGDRPFGIGVSAATLAGVVLDRFEIRGGPLCGLQLDGAQVELTQGTVGDFVIGVCVQDASYDLSRLERGVRYERNGANLRATSLPVPETSQAIE